MRDEASAIEHLARLFAAPGRASGLRAATIDEAEIGIGDDAAVVSARENLVWTIDEQAENTHFRRDWLSWRDVGYRSLVAAASDIAAMGGAATHALSALALPRDFRDEDFLEIAEGQLEAARAVGARIVGGNMTRASEAHITTTVMGNAARPVLRSGAKVGDGVYVAGVLGLAAIGMRALERKCDGADVRAAIEAWRRPPILFAASREMSATATAAIDVSDGLARDLDHVARSSGVRIELDEARLTEHAERHGVDRAASALGENALSFVLHGGEDYALVVTCDREIPLFFRIGSVVAGNGVGLGARDVEPRGFDHF